jgi:hypothetical protein
MSKTVTEALQYVASHPVPPAAPIDAPVWELVARALFEVANSPDVKNRGSLARATKAQKMIADRLVGKRRPGTAPAVRREQSIEFVDLTAGAIADE